VKLLGLTTTLTLKWRTEHSRFSKDEVYSKLVNDFEKKGSMYPRLFNDALNDFGLDQSLASEILRLYTNVDSKIRLFPEAKKTLLTLRGLGLKLA
jgi:hypothetical protein